MGETPGNHGVTRDANAVSISQNDWTFQKSTFFHPRSTSHLTIAVEGKVSGKHWIIHGRNTAGQDRRHAGPHRTLAHFQFPFATDDCGVPNLNASDVGNRVEFSRCAIERDSQIACANLFLCRDFRGRRDGFACQHPAC